MNLRVVAMLACALSLCLALAGCGGGSADEAQAADSQLSGEWKLVAMEDGENFDADSLALADSLGLEAKLTLNSDGSGTLVLLSDEQSVSWTASGDTEGTATIDGRGDVALQLSGDVLSITGGQGDPLEFTRL